MAKRALPPLNGLRALEAAARLGSFAAAAAELGVTPGAVSQRVRDLEDRLQITLFDRRPQALHPTRAALELQPTLTTAFDAIAEAVHRVRTPFGPAIVPLCLAAPAGFAALWLLPRLAHFAGQAPEIAVTLTATGRLIEPGGAGDGAIDACIRFGRAGWSGDLACDFLFNDRRIAVCSPAYLRAHPLGTAPEARLEGQTVLEALSAPEDWVDWASSTGSAPAQKRLSFGDERLTLDAAIGGLGIALSDRAFVGDALHDGRLIAPFEPLEMMRGTAWFLVYRATESGTRAIADFRAWLLDQCGAGARG